MTQDKYDRSERRKESFTGEAYERNKQEARAKELAIVEMNKQMIKKAEKAKKFLKNYNARQRSISSSKDQSEDHKDDFSYDRCDNYAKASSSKAYTISCEFPDDAEDSPTSSSDDGYEEGEEKSPGCKRRKN